jgi:hypothetical protein
MNVYLVFSSTNGIEMVGVYDCIELAMATLKEFVESNPSEEYVHVYKLPLNESSEGKQVAGYSEEGIWGPEDV